MFKILDRNAYSQPISINNQIDFKTNFGSFLTILLIIITILCSIAFGKDLVSKTKQSIVMADNIDTNGLITRKKIEISMAMMFQGGFLIKDLERKIVPYITFFDTNAIDRKNENITLIEIFNMTKCNKVKSLKDSGMYNKMKTKWVSPEENYYCLGDNYKYNITNSFGEPKFGMPQLTVGICRNASDLGPGENPKFQVLNYNNDCYPRDEIQKELSTFYVQFVYTINYVDSSAYREPVKSAFDAKISRASALANVIGFVFLKSFDYLSDDGLLLENIQNYEGYSTSKQQFDFIFDPGTKEVFAIAFTNDPFKLTYRRTYIKLQKVAADIGGVIKFFSTFFYFIGNYYSKTMMTDYFINLFKEKVEDSDGIHIKANSVIINEKIIKNDDFTQDTFKKDESSKVNNFLENETSKNKLNILDNSNQIPLNISKDSNNNFIDIFKINKYINNKLFNVEAKQHLSDYKYDVFLNFSRFCCKQCQNSKVKILLKTESYLASSISLEKILNFTEEYSFLKEVSISDEKTIKYFELKSHENFIHKCFT